MVETKGADFQVAAAFVRNYKTWRRKKMEDSRYYVHCSSKMERRRKVPLHVFTEQSLPEAQCTENIWIFFYLMFPWQRVMPKLKERIN